MQLTLEQMRVDRKLLKEAKEISTDENQNKKWKQEEMSSFKVTVT